MNEDLRRMMSIAKDMHDDFVRLGVAKQSTWGTAVSSDLLMGRETPLDDRFHLVYRGGMWMLQEHDAESDEWKIWGPYKYKSSAVARWKRERQ